MAKTKESAKAESKKPTTSKSTAKTSTKESAKESPKKETKPALEKLTLSVRQVGKNLNVVLGNEKFTRVGTKEELQEVKDFAKAYDTKPTKANLEALKKSLKPETAKVEAKKDELKAESKKAKKEIKNAPKDKKKTVVSQVVAEIDDKLMSDEELKQMEDAIARQKEKKQAVAKQTSTVPKGREW